MTREQSEVMTPKLRFASWAHAKRLLANLALRVRLVALVALFWLASPAMAWAQDDEPEEKKYTMPYILAVLVIAISLVVVLKPANRDTEIKLRPYDD